MKYHKTDTPKIMYLVYSYYTCHHDTTYENTRNEHKHIVKLKKDTRTHFLFFHIYFNLNKNLDRGGSRAAATSKMECFVIIVNSFQPLTIIIKHSIVDVAAALDPPLPWRKRKSTYTIIIKTKAQSTQWLVRNENL